MKRPCIKHTHTNTYSRITHTHAFAGNEVDQKRKVCNDLQRMWMSTQTELVKLSNEAALQSEKVGEMKSQAAVLTQKRVRVEGQVRVQQGEISKLACVLMICVLIF